MCVCIYVFSSNIYFVSLCRNKIRVPCLQHCFNPIFPTTNISCNYYNRPRKKRELSAIDAWVARG